MLNTIRVGKGYIRVKFNSQLTTHQSSPTVTRNHTRHATRPALPVYHSMCVHRHLKESLGPTATRVWPAAYITAILVGVVAGAVLGTVHSDALTHGGVTDEDSYS